ncbi:MAG TPA: hypothetical protein DCR69_09130 [Clostridium sp.]|nr:hypothetical protein [Clostridium sp.]
MDGFEALDKAFENLIKAFPKARRGLVEEVGNILEKNVISNIESGTDEDTGDLKRGVKKVIGSRGGYVAVKPDYNIAPHTHLVESGHRLVRGGKVIGWVPGKHMYRNAINSTANEIENKADAMLDKLMKEFENG